MTSSIDLQSPHPYFSYLLSLYHSLNGLSNSVPLSSHLSLPICPFLNFSLLSLPITPSFYPSLPFPASVSLSTYHSLFLPIIPSLYLSPPPPSTYQSLFTYQPPPPLSAYITPSLCLSHPLSTYHPSFCLSFPLSTYHPLSLPITPSLYSSLPPPPVIASVCAWWQYQIIFASRMLKGVSGSYGISRN